MDELGWRMSITLCQVLPWGRGLGSKAGSVHIFEAQGCAGALVYLRSDTGNEMKADVCLSELAAVVRFDFWS